MSITIINNTKEIRKSFSSLIEIKPALSFYNNKEDLPYLIGALRGDGYVTDRVIQFNVTDKSFSDSVKSAMEKIGFVVTGSEYEPKNCKWKKQLRIFTYYGGQEGHDEFYKLFLNMQYPSNSDETIPYLKGFYEAEGCCCNVNKNSSTKRISLSNKNIQLLEIARSLLKKLNFNTSEIYVNKKNGVGALCLCKNKEVPRFLELINPCIKYGEKR